MTVPNPLAGATTVSITYRTKTETRVDMFVEQGDSGWLADQLAAVRKKALAAGHTIINKDGSHDFISTVADYVDGKEIFADDGDRIRCTRMLVHTDGINDRVETPIRKVWVDYSRYYDD